MKWQMDYSNDNEAALLRMAKRLNGQLRNRRDGLAIEISKSDRWQVVAILGEPTREARDTRTTILADCTK